MKQKWSKDLKKKAEAEKLYAEGFSSSYISKRLELPYTQVRDIVYKEVYREKNRRYLSRRDNYAKHLARNRAYQRKKKKEALKAAGL